MRRTLIAVAVLAALILSTAAPTYAQDFSLETIQKAAEQGDANAQNNLGATYLAMGRWDDAIPIFEKLAGNALYKSPGLALNNLGWAYYNKTDLKKARFKFLEAIAMAPKLCPAYNNLAMVQIDEGRLEKAKKTLERGIKRCKSYAEPHFHLGRVAHRQGDLEGARKHFGRCLELAGDSHLADRCEQRLKALPPSVGRR